MKIELKAVLATASIMALPQTIHAQAAPQGAAQPTKVKPERLDPGEILCEKVRVFAGRIGGKTVCMTRLQWQENKTFDREFMERATTSLQLRDGG